MRIHLLWPIAQIRSKMSLAGSHLRWRLCRVRSSLHVLLLPDAPRRYLLRCAVTAVLHRDGFALRSSTPPPDICLLLQLAEGRKDVVELGTAAGWLAGALVVADPTRVVRTFDPFEHGREKYLALMPAEARERLHVVGRPGAATDHLPLDMLFIDGSHTKSDVVDEFEAWRPYLREGGVVAFHDYAEPNWPGVAEAVVELGLAGQQRRGMFLWINERDPAKGGLESRS